MVGECIRCNVQLEGSGVSADDVIVEAGDAKAGNGGPSAVGHKKDVGIFADRADGFVLRNMTVRHAREHDIYMLETDGYLLDRFKTYYAGAYGVLTFVEDHGLIQNCEAVGNGDSGLYPGSGAATTDNRYEKFYPKYRFSQTVRWCDSHHNTSGFSGTNSHGTLITENNFYDNALGYTTDVFTAPGHPGFPQHGNVIENNNFYSNNFNPFAEGSDVQPFIPAPVGTGLWLAGGNVNTVTGNHFYDNWRRGLMLFGVPDATVCGPTIGSTTPVPGCDPTTTSTSYDNRFHDNVMGVSPAGKQQPNGLDFWWDNFPGNTGNCWWDNTGADGGAVTSSPRAAARLRRRHRPQPERRLRRRRQRGRARRLSGRLRGLRLPRGQLDHVQLGEDARPSRVVARASPPVRAMSFLMSQQAQFASICSSGLAPRLCGAYQGWSAVAHRVPVARRPGRAVHCRRAGRSRARAPGRWAATPAAGGARPTRPTAWAWCSGLPTSPRCR